MQNEHPQPSVLTIPTAIIIAGAIIAVAIIYTMKPQSGKQVILPDTKQHIKGVTSSDHIMGNPAAKIKIVEYSDTSCPFCKMFHNTMRQVMATYGKSGEVAWVYRHFPIDQPGTRPDGSPLHPNAGIEAQATECANAQGGADKFWAYTNRLYEVTPSVTNNTPDGLDPKMLHTIAREVKLDTTEFRTCLESGRFKNKVEMSYNDGLSAGITGTPTSFFILPGNKQVTIEGAQDYQTLKASIDAILADGK